jgi:hypothetical protein
MDTDWDRSQIKKTAIDKSGFALNGIMRLIKVQIVRKMTEFPDNFSESFKSSISR